MPHGTVAAESSGLLVSRLALFESENNGIGQNVVSGSRRFVSRLLASRTAQPAYLCYLRYSSESPGRNGTGTVRRRKDGRWECRLWLGDGKTRSVYGATMREVQDKLRELERQQENGIDLNAKPPDG
jgi:hypothetical protein